jgi:hypothetical protein
MVSWKDHGDPTPGLFSIQLDPNGSPQYILQWNKSILYWATGNWSDNAYVGVPELSPTNMYPNSGYTFQFVDSDTEMYFTYTVKNDAQTFTRAIVDVSGLFQTLVWTNATQAWTTFFTQPKAKCTVYGVCVWGGTTSVVRMLHHHAAASRASFKSTPKIGNWAIIQQAVGETSH